MSSADLLPARHSGFGPGHSTVTAVLREVCDILLAVDRQVKSSQVLSIKELALQWFQSYLLCAWPVATHIYADDTQVYGSCRPASVDDLSSWISDSVGPLALFPAG